VLRTQQDVAVVVGYLGGALAVVAAQIPALDLADRLGGLVSRVVVSVRSSP
jgi:hypothetical protein